jgi:hypothetical protein
MKTWKHWFFVSFFIFIAFSAFGQQFLWSTDRNHNARHISMNNVAREVLEFYDQYEFYLDYTGFSKDRFLEDGDFGFDDWEWISDIENLTVFALRTNLGRGSVVLVITISMENINMVVFTNTYERDVNHAFSSRREQFSRWFRTLLN